MSVRLVHPKYRPDIDGLRAIAVLAVIGFHAFPQLVPGGFIGVDVFFVLSGFLISTIVFESLRQGSFSFATFYSRRIRRIFPAFVTVLFAVMAFGWFLLVPTEYKQVSFNAANSASFILNFALSRDSGYFMKASELKPLLHLWSLSVEEQFYLFFPLLWLAGAKLKIKPIWPTLAFLLLSFQASGTLLTLDANKAFYYPQSRFWELLIGAVLAHFSLAKGEGVEKPGLALLLARFAAHPFYERAIDIKTRLFGSKAAYRLRRGLAFCRAAFNPHVRSLIGAAALAGSLAFFSNELPFPRPFALIPTLGAALLISAGPRALFNRFALSLQPLVWIGLISYPLYLWHYPLLSFATILSGDTPSLAYRAGIVAALFPIAWATYRFIERPLRFQAPPVKAVSFLCLALLLIGAASYAVYRADGIEGRTARWVTPLKRGKTGNEAFFDLIKERYVPCTDQDVRRAAPDQIGDIKLARCFQSKPSPDLNVVIIGDSHAEHLFPGLAAALPDKNVAYYIPGAPPPFTNSWATKVLEIVAQSPSVKSVILSSRWFGRMNRVRTAGTTLEKDLDRALNLLAQGKGKKIYLLDDFLFFSFKPGRCKYDRTWPFGHPKCEEPRATQKEQMAVYSEQIEAALHRHPDVRLVKSSDYFCDQDRCFMAKDGKLFFRDFHHLNAEGSAYVAQRLLTAFPDLAQ